MRPTLTLPPTFAEPYSRRACLRDLLRLPTQDEIQQEPVLENWTSRNETQYQISLLVKDYQGIDVPDLDHLYRLTNHLQEARSFVATIYMCHSMYLYKNPLQENMAQFFCWLRLYGRPVAEAMLMDWIQSQNEYKYLGQCLEHFLQGPRTDYEPAVVSDYPVSKPADTTEPKKVVRIRYYGPIGTSGYATVCRDIVRCLTDPGSVVEVSFVPLSVQNFNAQDEASETSPTREACPCTTLTGLRDTIFLSDPVDLVVLHSVPDLWIPIVRREKQANPYVVTCGITVWETSHVPPQWIPHLRWVDRVSFPNQWNTAVFQNDVHGLDVAFLPHPVLPRSPLDKSVAASMLADLMQEKRDRPGLYVLYTINEFSGRKGVELLLKVYAETFAASEDVCLFVKTHGSVSKEVAQRYLERLTSTRNCPRIYLDYSRWDENDITLLHQTADCFVSLTRSEGHGLGACTAALMGNHVIMTGYGGQLDYLCDIDFVAYREVPASFCSLFDTRHQACLDGPCCQYFPFFLPAQQAWALPDLGDAARLLRQAVVEKKTGKYSTAKFLQQSFGTETIRDRFGKYFVSTALGEGNRVSVPVQGLEDTYDQPDELFQPQRSLLCPEDLEEARLQLPPKQPTVLSLSCAGYGNVGDDLYGALHRHHLGKDYILMECNTQTYVHAGGKLAWLPKPGQVVPDEDIQPFDYLVIGGGGIINATEMYSSIFRVYLDYCKRHSIPISLISVGCAYPQDTGRDPVLPSHVGEAWQPLLAYANLITTRSLTDRDTILSFLPTTRHHRVRLLPDLAYGAPLLYPSLFPVTSGGRYLLYIPTNFMCTKYPDVVHLLQQKLWEHPSSRLVFLAMDGLRKAGEYPAPFITEELARFRTLFPDALVYTGRYMSGAFKDLVGGRVPSDSIIQSLGTVVDLFRRAVHVVTGRYHGLILAKAFQVPYDIGTANLSKLVDEARSVMDPNQWKDSYTLLKEDIGTSCMLPAVHKGLLDMEPNGWPEDQRNRTIVDIVTQPLPESWESTVPFIQGLTNRQLMEKRLYILNKRYGTM